QVLTAYLENRANAQLQTKLDGNNYKESELISVKVPVQNLSYYNSSTQFERVEGQIEIHGLQYSYVKRRLFNDSIEMLCIPNRSAIHLKNAKNDFFKLVNDIQRPGQDKKTDSHTFKNITGDYWTVSDQFRLENQFYRTQNKFLHNSVPLSCNSQPTDEHPPQRIA
ncbi:MAG TPA: hypothetical protein VK711_08265, partial [Puia sp.]|nr:hypothetical protein [Puia sp.]